MSISLKKGDKISLEKSSGGALSRVRMGLGWDPAKPSGFFKKMFAADAIDLDASCILFDVNRNVLDVVWFQQLKSKEGAVIHTGDNLTGEGDGDDESIVVDLPRLPANVQSLVFTVNSFQGQTFNEVDNSFCRLIDESNSKEIARYNLKDKGTHTGVIMAVVSRNGSEWSMTAHGKPLNGRTVQDMIPEAGAVA